MTELLPETSYLLKLNEHLEWCLVATGPTRGWLDKLAQVMGLERGYSSTCPRLLFVPKTIENHGGTDGLTVGDTIRRMGLPTDGWKVDHLRPVWMWTHPHSSDMLFELPDSQQPAIDAVSMFHTVFPIYRSAIHFGGIPLHAALVERHGWASLLCGSSGTGKSTCCRRFPEDWTVLSDDETLILPARSESYRAHPFPTWSDYWFESTVQEQKVERGVPLGSVLFLEHAETRALVPIGQGEAATRINRSALQIYDRTGLYMEKSIREPMRVRIFDNACRLARTLPAFILRTGLSSPFWEDVEKSLPRAPEG